MAVKLARIVFRKIGGIVVPVRDTAKIIGQKVIRVLPELAPPQKISEHFDVKQGLKTADFFLQRKGSELTVGMIRKAPNLKEDIGIKVKDTNKIVSNYAKYAFDYLHQKGFWKHKAHGTLALKNLKTSTVAKTSIEDLFPTMKKQREDYEASAHAVKLAISKKNLMKVAAEIKKGSKLVETGVRAGEMRMIRVADRKVNARAKGIVFRRIGGRVVPIRRR
jgi:hypothetical protein